MNIDLVDRFLQLSELLADNRNLWQPKAFHHHHLPVMESHPELVHQLLSLPPEQVELLSRNNRALSDFFAPHFPFAERLFKLTELPMLQGASLPPVSPHFHNGIPGRKWQQVEAFARAIPHPQRPILEWCAGKSHLGFYLQHQFGQPVTALEWDESLVAQANRRAERDGSRLNSHTVDVLTEQPRAYLKEKPVAVALHACGDLHERLLKLAIEHQLPEIHIAPCCYHKRADNIYRPLSALAQKHDLILNKSDLHTAVAETANAGATVQRQRVRLQTMRLGFDCLQRDVRGIDKFLSIPSLPAKWVKVDFKTFCRYCATQTALPLKDEIDWESYWLAGQQRFREVAALDLVKLLFRRALEVWLVLDRGLLLSEYHYRIEVNRFCNSALTPRNLLISANSNEHHTCG